MSIPRSDSLMAFACVISPISRNTADLLIRSYLPQQIRQHGCVTNIAASHFNCPYLQRFFVDPNVYLAPQAAFGPPVLAGIPFPFALSFDASAVH